MKKTKSVEKTIIVAGIPCGSAHTHTGILNNQNNQTTNLKK